MDAADEAHCTRREWCLIVAEKSGSAGQPDRQFLSWHSLAKITDGGGVFCYSSGAKHRENISFPVRHRHHHRRIDSLGCILHHLGYIAYRQGCWIDTSLWVAGDRIGSAPAAKGKRNRHQSSQRQSTEKTQTPQRSFSSTWERTTQWQHLACSFVLTDAFGPKNCRNPFLKLQSG